MQKSLPELISNIVSQKEKLKHLEVGSTNVCHYCLGLTGSGKSTYISYMCGAHVEFAKQGLKYVLSHNQKQKYPLIGNTNVSCTDISNSYTSEGITYFDSAGFEDTNGVHQEILNSYSNSKMFKKGNKAKIVLVVEFSTLIASRGGDLPRVGKRLSELFRQDFKQIIQSCVLVVSKVDTKQYQLNDIVDTIQGIAQSTQVPECSALLNTIVSHKRVLLLPLPQLIDQSTIQQLKSQILKVSPFVLKNDAYASLSTDALNQIQQFSNNLGTQINSVAGSLAQQIRNKFARAGQIKSEILLNQPKIKSAKDILTSNQVAGDKPQGLQKLATIVDLNKQEVAKVKGLFDQMQFCKTLHQKVAITSSIENILMVAVTECQAKLSTMLQAILERERQEQYQRVQEAARIQRQAAAAAQRIRLEQLAQQRAAETRRLAQQEHERLQRQYAAQQAAQQAEKARVQAQIQAALNRPPQVVYHHSSRNRICEIM